MLGPSRISSSQMLPEWLAAPGIMNNTLEANIAGCSNPIDPGILMQVDVVSGSCEAMHQALVIGIVTQCLADAILGYFAFPSSLKKYKMDRNSLQKLTWARTP